MALTITIHFGKAGCVRGFGICKIDIGFNAERAALDGGLEAELEVTPGAAQVRITSSVLAKYFRLLPVEAPVRILAGDCFDQHIVLDSGAFAPVGNVFTIPARLHTPFVL